ncbi:MAG: hypothetical protein KAZ71_06135 [Bacteroidia bacterium]|nr:hypothetical protein [Bacteroidia bacterium]
MEPLEYREEIHEDLELVRTINLTIILNSNKNELELKLTNNEFETVFDESFIRLISDYYLLFNAKKRNMDNLEKIWKSSY